MPYQCDPCVCPEQHYRDSMSWRKAMITLLCRIAGYTGGGEVPAVDAVFNAAVSLGAADIGAAYSLETTLASARKLMIDNQTDGDVWISFDGVANNFYLRSGQNLNIDFIALGVTSSAPIYVRDGSVVATLGILFIYSVG